MLEMWQVHIEMCFNYKINDWFQGLSTTENNDFIDNFKIMTLKK